VLLVAGEIDRGHPAFTDRALHLVTAHEGGTKLPDLIAVFEDRRDPRDRRPEIDWSTAGPTGRVEAPGEPNSAHGRLYVTPQGAARKVWAWIPVERTTYL
jgi:hypothetical protein